MKFLLLLFVAFSFCLSAFSQLQKAELLVAKKSFKELKKLNKNGRKIWKHDIEGPLLIVNKDTRIVYANQQDANSMLKKQKGCYVGTLPPTITVANTSVEWNGTKWAMVVLPLPDDAELRKILLAHESFHRIQPQIGFSDLREKDIKHLDEEKGRIYLRFEIEALKAALNASNYGEQKMHILNALTFRKYRHAIFPEAFENENSLEMNEGLAEYTGIMASGLKGKKLQDYLIKQLDAIHQMPSFVRAFAYFTIPAYGYFLHSQNKYWNKGLNSSSKLSNILFDNFGSTDETPSARNITAIADLYGGGNFFQEEHHRLAEKQVRLQKLKWMFHDSMALTLGIEKMNISFNPASLFPIPEFGTAYQPLRLTDTWGILEADSAVLIHSNWNKATVSAPISVSDSGAFGEGWKLILNEGWAIIRKDNRYLLQRK
jgi:hypothetical protein